MANQLALNESQQPLASIIWICFLAGLYAIYDFYIQVLPGVMVPNLMRSFHCGAASIGLLGSAFYFSYAITQPPSGYFIDRFGVRNALIFFSLMTGVVTVIFSLSSQLHWAVICRVLSGFGVCIGFIASYYIAARLLPHRYFSMVAAILHLGGTFGAVIAQTPLAVMISYVGWRAAITASGLIGIVLSFIYYLFIHMPEEPEKTQSKWEMSFKESFIFCFKIEQLRWIACCGFLSWLPMSVLGAMWGVPYLMKVYQVSSVEASKVTAWFWVGSAFGGIALSMVSERFKRRRWPIIIVFSMAFISGLFVLFASHFSMLVMSFCFFILGVTICIQTLTFALVKENITPNAFGLASGMNNLVSMMSGVLGQQLVGWLLFIQSPVSTHYSIGHYQIALLIVPLVSLLGIYVSVFRLKETYCRPYL